MAPHGSQQFYRTLDYLSYISTELHGVIVTLFNPSVDEAVKTHAKAKFEQVEISS